MNSNKYYILSPNNIIMREGAALYRLQFDSSNIIKKRKYDEIPDVQSVTFHELCNYMMDNLYYYSTTLLMGITGNIVHDKIFKPVLNGYLFQMPPLGEECTYSYYNLLIMCNGDSVRIENGKITLKNRSDKVDIKLEDILQDNYKV